MELVLFIGLQGSGKSSFYLQRFYRTHVRVNLDMLKTRHREELLIKACLEGKTRFVVDNTNLTKQSRERYLIPARNAGFARMGYFFDCLMADALKRNAMRAVEGRVPNVAIYSANARLERPSLDEGFDQLFVVRLQEPDNFIVEQMHPAV